ncbi:unnamed protein product, partial [marine sediment metagenome]
YGKGSALVIGESGLREELRRAGIKISNKKSVDFVVVGLDFHFTYKKLSNAMDAIENGALFIAANMDPTLPVERGCLPGSGAIVSALSTCAGKKPDAVIGKPNTYILTRIMKRSGMKRKETALVGDRLDIDMAAANRAGVYPICVLTGVTSRKEALKARGENKPKKVISSIRDLPSLLK